MTDHDKLIQLVELHPVLWDQSLERFKDRDEKEKAWKEVAMDMDENWDLLSDQVQKARIAGVKKQWKHIRDAYMRSTRPPKSGDAASKKKKYVYADALTFLKNSLEKRRTCGNFEEVDTQSQHSTQGANEEEEEDLSDGNVDGSTASPSRPAYVSSETPRPASARSGRRQVGGKGMTKFQSVLLEKIGEPPRPEEDADCKFLQSLHPKMAKLTESQKIDFQLHCLLFFKDLQNPQNQYPSRADSPFLPSRPHSFPSVPQHFSHLQRRPPFPVPHFPKYPYSAPSSPLPPPPSTTPQTTSSEPSPQWITTQSDHYSTVARDVYGQPSDNSTATEP